MEIDEVVILAYPVGRSIGSYNHLSGNDNGVLLVEGLGAVVVLFVLQGDSAEDDLLLFLGLLNGVGVVNLGAVSIELNLVTLASSGHGVGVSVIAEGGSGSIGLLKLYNCGLAGNRLVGAAILINLGTSVTAASELSFQSNLTTGIVLTSLNNEDHHLIVVTRTPLCNTVQITISVIVTNHNGNNQLVALTSDVGS